MFEELVLKFDREKETKNTIRFTERESEDGEPPMIGILYLQKFAVKRLGDPSIIEVKIRKE